VNINILHLTVKSLTTCICQNVLTSHSLAACQ